MSEKEIIDSIEQLKRGKLQAFNAIILHFEKPIYNLAFRMLLNREDAEEVAQDSFVKAYQHIKSFKGQAKFSTWLYRICYNNCLNKLQTNKKQFLMQDVEHAFEVISDEKSQDLLMNSERKHYIQQALGALSAQENTLLSLYYQSDCSLAEIEVITTVPKENLKVQLHRARKRLEVQLRLLLKDEVKNVY